MSPSGPTEVFEAERPGLLGLAYRMLGSRSDAEDVVQEAWLRFQRRTGPVTNPAAWLTTVTSRLALDQLRSARHRREAYVGPWLPEPVVTAYGSSRSASEVLDPADRAALADSLTLGFLVVLDELSPEDRVVFLLADVFAVPYSEIAEVVGRTPGACRQAASRARRRVRGAAPATGGAPAAARELAGELVAALASGDVDRTLALLAPDVVVVTDGGPNRRAARRPVVGAGRACRFLVNVATRVVPDTSIELAELNATPAVVVRVGGAPDLVMVVEPGSDGRVAQVLVVSAPEKVAGLDVVLDLA